jgi:GAF domain-containing protein
MANEDRLNSNELDWLQEQRHRIINILLGLVVGIGPLGIIPGLLSALDEGEISSNLLIYVAAYLVILVLFIFRRIRDDLRALFFLLVVYGFGASALYTGWLAGGGRLFLLATIPVSAILIAPRASFHAAALALFTFAVFAFAFSQGVLTLRDLPDPTTLSPIIVEGVGYLLVIGLTVITPLVFQRALAASAEANSEAQSAHALSSQRAEELERVNRLLTERADAMTAIAEIASEATATSDPQQILNHIVRLISDRLGYYHSGVFLIDEAREYAVLQAASSPGGRRMVARGHRLEVGQEGIVGYVTGYGEARVTEDVTSDVVYFANPDLPETRAEIALPLRARGEIIGALDVQSTEPMAFPPEKITILQTLADQIATVIDNARLFSETQIALDTTRRAYGEITRAVWDDMIRAQPEMNERFDPQGLLPDGAAWREETEMAWERGQTVVSKKSEGIATASTPIRVRGQVIGVLDAHKPTDGGAWTAEELSLLETLTEQLGVALESARSYQETQRRAAREQMTREITDKMSRAMDMDHLLQITVEEMTSALGIPGAFVQLSAPINISSDEDSESGDSYA